MTRSIHRTRTKSRALKKVPRRKLETFAQCKVYRSRVISAATHLSMHEMAEKLKSCKNSQLCLSGLCPVCVRKLRKRLLSFASNANLHDQNWLFVTVFIKGWTLAPGDMTPFGALKEHRLIVNFKRQLHRLVGDGLVVIGSIESDYQVVANVPKGKPFHLHFLISGASKALIEKAVKTSLPLDKATVQPLRLTKVGKGTDDFLATLSYVFKQTFWKKSKLDLKARARRQWPKRAELAELISNLGVHTWNGRLIIAGVRCDRGYFRLTRKLSSTVARKPG